MITFTAVSNKAAEFNIMEKSEQRPDSVSNITNLWAILLIIITVVIVIIVIVMIILRKKHPPLEEPQLNKPATAEEPTLVEQELNILSIIICSIR